MRLTSSISQWHYWPGLSSSREDQGRGNTECVGVGVGGGGGGGV